MESTSVGSARVRYASVPAYRPPDYRSRGDGDQVSRALSRSAMYSDVKSPLIPSADMSRSDIGAAPGVAVTDVGGGALF